MSAFADDPALAPARHDALPIAETFTSIQGEGAWAGAPSFFIRVSGCNLRCAWCDTPYASWRPEGDRRTLDAILDQARDARVSHAVITGGEPMIFPAVATLARGLRDLGLRVTIETAGTAWLDAHADLMSISPKLASSTPRPDTGWAQRHEQRRLNIPVLQRLLDAHPPPARQLKFVFTGEHDLPEIDALLAHLRGVTPDDVMLMPEGVTPQALAARRDAAVRACLSRGWRYSHRLHIDLFGNTRGT